ATVRIPLAEDEKIFMNGFQSWTYCPEYPRIGYTRGIGRLPKPLVNHYGLERYGDYYFVDYPETPGVTHGVSYCYFRSGERYRLLASLDERPGYTLFSYESATETLTIRRDCAGLRREGDFAAFELFYAEGTEAEVFDGWFAALGVSPRTKEPIAGYSSWYNRYEAIDQESIRSDLAGCAGQLRPGDVFQIDDGWEPAVGDWLEPDGKKFPQGMKAAADAIHAAGFRAGLWLAPFACRKGSRLYREHPDWMLRVDGKPWYCGINWGGFYALDIDKPQVQDYLERVFDRVLNQWGYDLVKLDFLYAAAPFGSETESRAGRMIRAMELLRRLCGEKKILGCGVPLMPAFGLVDYCRIGCDVGLDWNDNKLMQQIHRERVSTKQSIGNTIFRRQLNGRAFLSDPDVFFLREENLKLTDREKEILSTVNSLFGGVLFHSDDMSRYRPEARAAYARLRRNREAENVRVLADRGLAVRYTLDGQEHELVIE
ncbi:MAG: alpha-galactosidase, partial [Oscillospiraceae bacterium]|nr:alpha-galactosidase [Oscillospiraceae bacterium]